MPLPSWIKSDLVKTLIDCIYDGIIIVDKYGKIIIFNNTARQLLEIDKDRDINCRIDELYPNTKLLRVLKTGKQELDQCDYINNTKLLVNRIPFVSSDGSVIGAIAVFHPVSEVRSLRDELSSLIETRSMLQAIINSTNDAISVVDEKGTGILINPAYTNLTGLTKKEVIGKPATADIPDQGESMHYKVLQTQVPVKNFRMKLGMNKKDVIVNVSPIFVDGKLKGSVGVVHDVSEIMKLTEELADARRIMRQQLDAKYSFEDIKGSSLQLAYAIEQANRAALTPASILLRGESGTGKELFAHAIHNASPRTNKKFVKVNCAALTESLLESELFGYSEGAFTGAKKGGKPGYFEESDGGTIFLDEIGELSSSLQSKLLRVLQEKEIVRVGDTKSINVDVRIITATNANLEHLIEVGKFREDLYYRINMIQITIPPLRHRIEDLPELAYYLLQKLNNDFGRNVTAISESAIHVMKGYSWPGNIRELENILGRAMINMKPGDTILESSHLPSLSTIANSTNKNQPQITIPDYHGDYQSLFINWEKNLLTELLKGCDGNKTEVSKLLNISIRNLYYKLDKHGLVSKKG